MPKNKFDNEVLYNTKEEALQADDVDNDGIFFWAYLADELWGNQEVVLKAMKVEDSEAILQNDRAFALEAIWGPSIVPFFTARWPALDPSSGAPVLGVGGMRNDWDGEVGFRFRTRTAVVVGALGRQALAGGALRDTVVVTLWSDETKGELARARVGQASRLEGWYTFTKLERPVLLPAEKEFRISQQCFPGMADRWFDGCAEPSDLSRESSSRYLELLGGVFQNGRSFPENVPSEDGHRWAGIVNLKLLGEDPAAEADRFQREAPPVAIQPVGGPRSQAAADEAGPQAIKNSSYAFKFATNDLKNDRGFVLKACEQNADVIKWASDDLQSQKTDILELAALGKELAEMTDRAEKAEEELADLQARFEGSPDERQKALREELLAVLGAVHETGKLSEAMSWFDDKGCDSVQDLKVWGQTKTKEFVDHLSLKEFRSHMLMQQIDEHGGQKIQDGISGTSTASDCAGKKLDDYKQSLEDQISSNHFEFWFLDATMLRRWDRSKDGPLRSHQELKETPGWLMMRSISLRDLLRGKYNKRYLVASHRWVDPDHPDKSCEKMELLRDWLRQEANRTIEGVWLDFGCLPQGMRTKKEQAMFDASLQVINLLFLGLPVLIFFDLQYVGRFWCLYEGFLAMHSAFTEGIRVAEDDTRCSFLCLGASKEGDYITNYRDVWKNKTVEEALAVLAKDDVVVTNKKDKKVQLGKLKYIDCDVKRLFNLTGEA